MLIALLCVTTQINASIVDGVSATYGAGRPGNLHGGRLSLIWDWDTYWFGDAPINMTWFLDGSVAYWRSDGDPDDHFSNKDLFTFAIAPIFRLVPNRKYNLPIAPFLEASMGLAVHTSSKLADRDLGSVFALQDILGAGLSFGQQRRFELIYRYIHYSNANLFSPNHGIDVKYSMTAVYRFG